MERLTGRKNGVCVYVGPGCKYPDTGEIPAEMDPGSMRNVLHKLALYEDTGLESLEVAHIKDCLGLLTIQDMNRLREIMEAERDGRLLVPPCKMGDTVYVYADREIKAETVVQIFIDDRGGFLNTLGDLCGGVYKFSSFGKLVFPTREAAESALKGREVKP